MDMILVIFAIGLFGCVAAFYSVLLFDINADKLPRNTLIHFYIKHTTHATLVP